MRIESFLSTTTHIMASTAPEEVEIFLEDCKNVATMQGLADASRNGT